MRPVGTPFRILALYCGLAFGLASMATAACGGETGAEAANVGGTGLGPGQSAGQAGLGPITPPASSGAGGGAGAGGQSEGRSPCDGWEAATEDACYWQHYGPTEPNEAWASEAGCGIPTAATLLAGDEVFVLLDCELLVQAAPGEQPADGWWFNDPAAPTGLSLGASVCMRLAESGFERIDVLYGC